MTKIIVRYLIYGGDEELVVMGPLAIISPTNAVSIFFPPRHIPLGFSKT